MPLTEAEKQHIAEEEAYRGKIREESQHRNKIASQTKKKGCSGCLVACLVIIGLLAITLVSINPAKQFETAEKNAQTTPILEINNGSFTTPTGEVYSVVLHK
jgi:hypothetical protein